MKRRYTLLDDVYFDALLRVRDALSSAALPFALVGGGAVQAWVATLRTDDGARRLGQEPRLRSALRSTSDLDFSTRAEPATVVQILNALAAEAGAGVHVLGPRAVRFGPVSIALTLDPSDLSGMSHLYDDFLGSRVPVRLRKGAQAQEVPTIGLAALLSTKLTRRGDKAKDLLDVTELLSALRDAGRTIDIEAVRAFLPDEPEALLQLAELADEGESQDP